MQQIYVINTPEGESEPLTFTIPETKPGDGASQPDTNNSYYDPLSKYPEIYEGELDQPSDPKVN